jgi:hypothetical protein
MVGLGYEGKHIRLPLTAGLVTVQASRGDHWRLSISQERDTSRPSRGAWTAGARGGWLA